MTRRDPRPRLASRRVSRPHAHPPEVCPVGDIDAHVPAIRHTGDLVSVLIRTSASHRSLLTLVVRTIERP